MAMRQMASVGKIHSEDSVAGLKDGGICGLIGLGAGVWLDVGVFGPEESLGTIARDVLDDVGELAAAIVALAGIAFGVLVGKDAAGGFEDGFGGEILAGYELQPGILPFQFVLDSLIDGRIGYRER